MENSFGRIVIDISNLSTAVKGKEFDANVRLKWNNYLNEVTSLDFNTLSVADVNVSFSQTICEIYHLLLPNCGTCFAFR